MTSDTIKTNSDISDDGPHILVIDNDQHVCRMMARLLQREGYRVSVATSLEEARHRAAADRPHLALVDVRMRDHKDLGDKSGLALAEELNPAIVKIFLTAYPDVDIATASLTPAQRGRSLAVRYITKSVPKKALTAIRQVIDEHVRINFDLQIQWEADLTADDYVRVIEADQADDFVRADLIDVLRRLFHRAQAIRVFPLSQDLKTYRSSPSGAVLLRVVPSYLGGVRAASRAVKIAAWAKIEQEIENYQEYVDAFADFRAARIQRHTRMHCLGGIEYTFVGTERGDLDEFASLRRYYQDHSADEIKQVLNDLFDNVYQFWRRSITQTREERDLHRLYFSPLKANLDKIRQATRRLFVRLDAMADWNKEPLHLPGLSVALPNPLLWLERWLADTGNVIVQTQEAITHGDLHSENVLIHQDRCWLIDFYRTGFGHYLRDIVELETDLKFNLLPRVDIAELMAFEARLLAPDFFARGEGWASELDNPGLDQAYRILFFLRAKAAELSSGALDLRVFFQALLYQTLNILRLDIIDVPRKVYALMSAALICQRLENWEQPWPIPQPIIRKDKVEQPPLQTESRYVINYYSPVYGPVVGDEARVEQHFAAPTRTIEGDWETLIRQVVTRLEGLSAQLGLRVVDLKRGQAALYRQVDQAYREDLARILAAVQQGRMEQGEMQATLDAVRRATRVVMERGLPMDAELRVTIADLTEAVESSLRLERKLELSLPLVPLFLDYKIELGVESEMDLHALWDELRQRVRGSKGSQNGKRGEG